MDRHGWLHGTFGTFLPCCQQISPPWVLVMDRHGWLHGTFGTFLPCCQQISPPWVLVMDRHGWLHGTFGTFLPCCQQLHLLRCTFRIDVCMRYRHLLQTTDACSWQRQFGRYIKEGVTADSMEEMYQKCHEAIRADPSPAG